MYPPDIAGASRAARLTYHVAVFALLALWLLPLFAVVLTSIRPTEDLVQGNVWGWPSHLSALENFAEVLNGTPMTRFLANSLVISLLATLGAVTMACMAGFGLAKYRFAGNTLFLALFIAGNFVPAQVLMIPVRRIFVDALGIYDTLFALILFHATFQMGFCTLFLRNFVKQIPESLLDSARMDGVSELRILYHVVLPLLRPAIAAVSILTFTFVWNDYFWSLVLVHSDGTRPVTAGLQSLQGMWFTSWNLVSAAALITALPPVLFFFLMQTHFIAGLTAGTGEE